MKYEWDLSYIIKRKNELEKKSQDDLRVKTDYNTYELLLELYLSTKSNYTSLTTYNDDDDSYEYSSISKGIIDNSLLVHNNIKNKKIPLNEKDLSKINLTNDEIFEIVQSIYSEIPYKKVKNLFKKFTNNNLICIVNNKYKDDAFYGLTLNDIENSIPYSFIYRNNNIIDIIALNHEIAHMIFRYKENENFSYTNRFYLGEIEGCLFDMICNEYLVKLGFSNNEINNLDAKRINMIKLSCSEIYNAIYKNQKFFTLDDIREDCKEIFSNLCAIDLYELYKKDKEQAMYNLNNLIHENNPNINKNLSRNGITFFEDDCQNLSKLMIKTKKFLYN